MQPFLASYSGFDNLYDVEFKLTDDLAKIEKLVVNYFDLLYFADADLIEKCFFSEATVNSVEQGRLVSIDMEGFAARISSRPSPSSIEEHREDTLKSIEIESPSTAMVKVEVNILGDRYHDYLTLMKQGGDWKIITKVFHKFVT